jgi:hypothetical protein
LASFSHASNFSCRREGSGSFTFTRGLTGDPQRPAGTGFGVATFLLGEVSGGQQTFRDVFSYHGRSISAYVQDDWRVNSRLVLNLGLRYDYMTSPLERFDRRTNFDPFVMNPATGTSGKVLFAGRDTARNFTDADVNNLGPRIGFAYSITNRIVARGGYGILYLNPESHYIQEGANHSLGYSATTTFTAPGLGPFKAFPFAAGPDFLLRPLGPGTPQSGFRGQTGHRYQDRNGRTPYTQQYNFTIQADAGSGWVVSASYAGNRGIKLPGADYDVNQLDPRYYGQGLALTNTVDNPFFGQIATGPLSARTITRSQLLRPFPDYLDIRTLGNTGAASTYHSLQLTVEKGRVRSRV